MPKKYDFFPLGKDMVSQVENSTFDLCNRPQISDILKILHALSHIHAGYKIHMKQRNVMGSFGSVYDTQTLQNPKIPKLTVALVPSALDKAPSTRASQAPPQAPNSAYHRITAEEFVYQKPVAQDT